MSSATMVSVKTSAAQKVAAAPRNSQVDVTRKVTIEFDANAHGLAFRFRPLVNHVDVHPGELATVE